MKARLVLNRLSSRGRVLATDPPAEKLDEVDPLSRFTVVAGGRRRPRGAARAGRRRGRGRGPRASRRPGRGRRAGPRRAAAAAGPGRRATRPIEPAPSRRRRGRGRGRPTPSPRRAAPAPPDRRAEEGAGRRDDPGRQRPPRPPDEPGRRAGHHQGPVRGDRPRARGALPRLGRRGGAGSDPRGARAGQGALRGDPQPGPGLRRPAEGRARHPDGADRPAVRAVPPGHPRPEPLLGQGGQPPDRRREDRAGQADDRRALRPPDPHGPQRRRPRARAARRARGGRQAARRHRLAPGLAPGQQRGDHRRRRRPRHRLPAHPPQGRRQGPALRGRGRASSPTAS